MNVSRQNSALTKVFTAFLITLLFIPCTQGQEAIKREVQFNGYTNHWQNKFNEEFRFGNLFKVARTQVEKTFMQGKVDLATDMGVPGLLMEEGFITGLLSDKPLVLKEPGLDELKEALSKGDVLAYLDPSKEAGEKVTTMLPEDWEWPYMLGSYQYGEPGLQRVDLFTIEKEGNTLYVVSTGDPDTRNAAMNLI